MAGVWTCDFLEIKNHCLRKKKIKSRGWCFFLSPQPHLQLHVFPQEYLDWQVDFWPGDTTLQTFDTACSQENNIIKMLYISYFSPQLVAYSFGEKACFFMTDSPTQALCCALILVEVCGRCTVFGDRHPVWPWEWRILFPLRPWPFVAFQPFDYS